MKGFQQFRESAADDWMAYESLKARDFKVSKTEAAAIRQRTIAASKAKDALNDLLRANGLNAPSSRGIELAIREVEKMIIPVALLKVVADEEPFFTDN